MSLTPRHCLKLLPLACVLLTACTLTQPVKQGRESAGPQWERHRQQVQNLQDYQARGAFAYLSDRQKVSARFFWHQSSEQRYRLQLLNPLGGTELELRAQPDSVQITDNQGKRYVGDNPQQMVRQLTGMAIPFDMLRLWMLGLPGDAQEVTFNDQSLIAGLTYRHDGQTWRIDYLSYRQDTTPPLPEQLELTQGDLRIKLKIDGWTIR